MIKHVSLQMVTNLYGNEILTRLAASHIPTGLNSGLYGKADYL